jgi:hypothetical protein
VTFPPGGSGEILHPLRNRLFWSGEWSRSEAGTIGLALARHHENRGRKVKAVPKTRSLMTFRRFEM